MTAPRLLKPKQVADRFGCPKSSVLAAIKSGDLPAIRFNQRVFRVAEVDAAAWYVMHGGRLKSTTRTTRPENTPETGERSLWADR